MIVLPEKVPITIAMDTYVVRKLFSPMKQNVIGYDLRYHPRLINSYSGTDGTEASLAVTPRIILYHDGRSAFAWLRDS